MITKNRSATIISGSQKSRACSSWRRSVRAMTHDGTRQCRRSGRRLMVSCSPGGSRSRAPRGWAPAGSTRVRRAPAPTSASTRSGTSVSCVELDGGDAVALVRAHEGKVAARRRARAGSSASSTTRAAGQYSAGELVRASPTTIALAVVHHDHLVGEPLGLEQEVRAHQDGLAVLGHLVDEAEHRAAPTRGRGPPSARRAAGGRARASTARASASRARMPVE